MNPKNPEMSPGIENVDQVTGPRMISDALSCYFYFGNTKSILSWFGFCESSLHATVYFMFMALLLFGVVNFEIYKEFQGKDKIVAVICAGTPFLFLFLSNLVSKLTFTLTGNGNGDKLLSFLMIEDSSHVVGQNAVHVRYFCEAFSSELLKFRVFIGGFGLFLVLFKVIVDFSRLSQDASPFYSVCTVAFWCYMCLSSVIANGFVYMAAIACKLHVIVFKNRLNEPLNSTRALLEHKRRLSKFLEQFGEKFSWYFASQAVMCQIASCMALKAMHVAYTNKQSDFFIPTDLIFFIVVEIPMFWSIRCVLDDLLSEFKTVHAVVAEKMIISENEELYYKWRFVAEYVTHYVKGVEVFGSTSRILLMAVLPLGIAAISAMGKLIP